MTDRSPSARELLARALRLRCPACGCGKPFRGLLGVAPRCEHCGYRYEREGGYFLGSVYFNYGSTALLLLALHYLLEALFGLSFLEQLPVLVPFGLLFPLAFLRHARALWMALDHCIAPPEPRDFKDPRD